MSKKSSKHIKNKRKTTKAKKDSFCCYIYFNSYYSNKKFK